MPELPEDPLNREPDLQDLISSFITNPKEAYDRNHGLLPELDAAIHRVRVDGAVSQPAELSVSNLQNDFEQHTVVCALQCAGNRRHTMRTKQREVQGIDWADAAVMNCEWRGPRLCDVLNRVAVTLSEHEKENAHVAFACHTMPCQEDEWYGASIPLSRALRPEDDVILALEMNGAPLTKEHGYPVRVITPGIAGARAVKWLDRITVQTRESDNFYMQHDYKILPEEAKDAESAKPWWSKVEPVQDMPVNSTIAVPSEGSEVQRDADGRVEVRGYALPSGQGGPVIRVDVGWVQGEGEPEKWNEAQLLHHEGEGKWSWKLWRARLAIPPGKGVSIYSRATDNAGNTQPFRSQWNLRGVCYNGYGESANLSIS